MANGRDLLRIGDMHQDSIGAGVERNDAHGPGSGGEGQDEQRDNHLNRHSGESRNLPQYAMTKI
jgi:hypothetical protein